MLSDFVRTPICMDCRELIPQLPDQCIDLVVADPPYDLGFWDWVDGWIELLVPKLKLSASIYVFCGIGEKSDSLSRILPIIKEHFIFKNLITWKKQRGYGTQCNWMYTREEIIFAVNGTDYIFHPQYGSELRSDFTTGLIGRTASKYPPKSKFKRTSNVWVDIKEITPGVGNSPEWIRHPTQKPEALIERIIKASSDRDSMVFDPFAGSFTTAFVAECLERNWIACDIDPHWVGVGTKRLDAIRVDLFDYAGVGECPQI